MATISEIRTWPVKGLGGVPLSQADCTIGQSLVLDRAYGIARGAAASSGRPESDFTWKDFVQLKNCPKLATLETEFDLGERVLILKRQGRQVARGQISQQIGRTLIEQFLTAYLKDDLQSPPKIVAAGEATFSDARHHLISIINLETLRDIERVAKQAIDPVRMRGNIYVDGLPAWSEFDWVGQEVQAGDARFRIAARIDRCAATHVNPATGERDLQVTRFLQGGFGHMDCGVFAEVIVGGAIAVGDAIG